MFMLLRLRWSGAGCLGTVLWLPVILLALALTDGAGGLVPGIAIAVGFVGAAGVVWLLGSWLNGRSPEPRHTIGTTDSQVPMEYSAAPYLVFGLVFGTSVLGRATSPVVGWVTFAVGLVVVIGGAGSLRTGRRRRTQIAATADRAALAERHGWLYEAKGPSDLALRWKSLAGWRVHSIVPFGVVSGEIEGVAFTAFDSETDLLGDTAGEPCTTWAVPLSHSYLRIVTKAQIAQDSRQADQLVDAFSPGGQATAADVEALYQSMNGRLAHTADEVGATTDVAGFAEALLTPEVRELTVAHQLVGWRIEGSDLLFTSLRRPTPLPAAELADTAYRLITLARMFPADLAARYGSAPASTPPAG